MKRPSELPYTSPGYLPCVLSYLNIYLRIHNMPELSLTVLDIFYIMPLAGVEQSWEAADWGSCSRCVVIVNEGVIDAHHLPQMAFVTP